mmetsp:Transcript_1347/g.1701  ORF Transcript_1347/g.1701 Transcript_1347/m.1701 type:complete len:476 (-) Transcript_1347:440-1867(-)
MMATLFCIFFLVPNLSLASSNEDGFNEQSINSQHIKDSIPRLLEEDYHDLPFCTDFFFDFVETMITNIGGTDYQANQTVTLVKVICSCSIDLDNLSSDEISFTLSEIIDDMGNQTDLCSDSVDNSDYIDTVEIPTSILDCNIPSSTFDVRDSLCNYMELGVNDDGNHDDDKECIDDMFEVMDQILSSDILHDGMVSICGTNEPSFIPAPSPSPTLTPTTTDTISVSVEFVISASGVATDKDKEAMQETIANSADVPSSNIKNLEIISTLTRRRRKLSDLSLVENNNNQNIVKEEEEEEEESITMRKLSTYSWDVSFDVVSSLSDLSSSSSSITSADDLTEHVTDSLNSDSFENDLISNLDTPITSVSEIIVITNTRSPSSSPTISPQKNNNKPSAGAVTMIIIIIVSILVFIILCVIAYKKYLVGRNEKREDNNNGTSSKIPIATATLVEVVTPSKKNSVSPEPPYDERTVEAMF